MIVNKYIDVKELRDWENANISILHNKSIIFIELIAFINRGLLGNPKVPLPDLENDDQAIDEILFEMFGETYDEVINPILLEKLNDYWRIVKKSEIKDIKFSKIIKGNGEKYGKYRMVTKDQFRKQVIIYDYDKYDLGLLTCLPKIGMLDTDYSFPMILIEDENGQESILYEASLPEIADINQLTKNAKGSTLLFGCGIGYWAYQLAENKDVDSLTIVEPDADLIKVFEDNVLCHIKNKDKVTIIRDDPVKYIDKVNDGEFDYIGVDIWNLDSPKCMYLSMKLKCEKFKETKCAFKNEIHFKSVIKDIKFYIIEEEVFKDKNIQQMNEEIDDMDDKYSYEYIKYFVLNDKEVSSYEDLNRFMALA